NGGALADGDGAGELDVGAVCVSGFSGSAGGFALVFSVAGCWSFTCCCNVWTNSLSDRTSSRSAWTSALVAGVEAAGEASGVWAQRRAAAQTASATQIRFLINFLTGSGTLPKILNGLLAFGAHWINGPRNARQDRCLREAEAHQWSGNRR